MIWKSPVEGQRKKRAKGKAVQWLEFVPVYLAFQLSWRLPLKVGHRICRSLGDLSYCLLRGRRRIALENVRRAYDGKKTEAEIGQIARQSCGSFIASLFETVKLVSLLKDPRNVERIKSSADGSSALFKKAKEIHDRANGCIFVTPHLGNWEFLPYIGLVAEIPLVIVVRPLDNMYLEKLFYSHRLSSGQIFLPKTNSLYYLQKALRQGKSVGMLPDQSTMRAVSVDYFGRKATTTPIPALLAILHHRPIVVVACCRRSWDFSFEGFVSEPIWPQVDQSEKTELLRLTREMNRSMEAVIRKYPEQYFWMHDRWKSYSGRKELFLGGTGV